MLVLPPSVRMSDHEEMIEAKLAPMLNIAQKVTFTCHPKLCNLYFRQLIPLLSHLFGTLWHRKK